MSKEGRKEWSSRFNLRMRSVPPTSAVLLSLHSIAIFVPIFRIGSGSAIVHLIFSFDPAFLFSPAQILFY
jgi:hypothetical protein